MALDWVGGTFLEVWDGASKETQGAPCTARLWELEHRSGPSSGLVTGQWLHDTTLCVPVDSQCRLSLPLSCLPHGFSLFRTLTLRLSVTSVCLPCHGDCELREEEEHDLVVSH